MAIQVTACARSFCKACRFGSCLARRYRRHVDDGAEAGRSTAAYLTSTHRFY